MKLVRPRTFCAIGFLVACFLFLTATVAGADTTTPILQTDESSLLPLVRWGGATGQFHTRVGFSVSNPGTWIASQSRNAVTGTLLGFANFFWQAALSLITQAISMNILVGAAKSINDITTGIGAAVIGSRTATGLLIFIIVAVLVWALWVARRQGFMGIAKNLGTRLVAVVLLILVASPSGSISASQTTNFPVGSSPWYIDIANQASNAIAGPLLRATEFTTITSSDDTDAYSTQASIQDGLDCTSYVDQMKASYLLASGTTGSTITGNADGQAALVLSNMWENSGLQVWKDIQFGSNDYANRTYCRLLDKNAGISVTGSNGTARHTFVAMSDATSKFFKSEGFDVGILSSGNSVLSDAPQALIYSGNVAVDKTMVGWAACTVQDGAWVVDEDLLADSSQADTACSDWFATKDDSTTSYAQAFNFTDGTDDMTNATAKEFVSSLQGESTNNGTVKAIAYLLSSIFAGGSFILLAAAVFIAKLTMVGYAMLLPLLLIATLIPGQDTGAKLASTGKTFVGYAIISALATALLAVITILTNFIITLSTAYITAGSVPAILIIGLAPVASIWILGQAFKRMGIPNPLSVSGALQWGSSAAGLGQAVTSGAVAGAVAGGLTNRLRKSSMDVATSALGNKLGNSDQQDKRGSGAHKVPTIGREAPTTDEKPLSFHERMEHARKDRAEKKEALESISADKEVDGVTTRAHGLTGTFKKGMSERMNEWDEGHVGATNRERRLATLAAGAGSAGAMATSAWGATRSTFTRAKTATMHPVETSKGVASAIGHKASAGLTKARSYAATTSKDLRTLASTGINYTMQHPVSAAGKVLKKGGKYAAIGAGAAVAVSMSPAIIPASVATGAMVMGRRSLIKASENRDRAYQEWKAQKDKAEAEAKAEAKATQEAADNPAAADAPQQGRESGSDESSRQDPLPVPSADTAKQSDIEPTT